MGGFQRHLPLRGAERKPFGTDDFDVGNADEGEDRAQILFWKSLASNGIPAT